MNPLNDLKTLRFEQMGYVATITLDRPEVLHALNAQMFDELERVFTCLLYTSDAADE